MDKHSNERPQDHHLENVPSEIQQTKLWAQLKGHPGALSSISSVRECAQVIASTIQTYSPEFTDHSIRHMDSLWKVIDQILTPEEIQKMSVSESYCLAISFYLHDLGMAGCATSEMESRIKGSPLFHSTVEHLSSTTDLTTEETEAAALSIACRRKHADSAEKLVTELIPGVDRFLIEDSELRNHYGTFVGRIAASHNWALAELDKKLGSSGSIAGFYSDQFDPAYVACVLRVADFAHMNRDRASLLEFAIRRRMPTESLTHWHSQSSILGPIRDTATNQLRFHSSSPIADVDAWWLFFTMAEGLDHEIRAVSRYLARRTRCEGRFSLTGVVGSNSPQEFSALVQPKDFEPIDLRIKPSSIDRLIKLLGGRSLYGNDTFAPVRELVQNSIDAISLRRAFLEHGKQSSSDPIISITLSYIDRKTKISVSDNGVGMSEPIISDYLLGIASDYWNSRDFFSAYPEVASSFSPAGRFGIGFLSVFMVADQVTVETETINDDRFRIVLRGVGQRGMMTRLTRRGSTGTVITLVLKDHFKVEPEKFLAEVRARFPTVNFPIQISREDDHWDLAPGWWRECSTEEFIGSMAQQSQQSITDKGRAEPQEDYSRQAMIHRYHIRSMDRNKQMGFWETAPPEIVTESGRFVATPDEGVTTVCLRGIFVSSVPSTGMVGLLNLEDLEVDAARSRGIGGEWREEIDSAREQLRPEVVSALGELASSSTIPDLFRFLSSISRSFGYSVLTQCSLPWIGVIGRHGSAQFVTPAEFMLSVNDHTEVVIAVDCGPWSIWKRRNKMAPESSKRALFIPLSEELAGFRIERDWDGPKEIIEAPLDSHLEEFTRARFDMTEPESKIPDGPLGVLLAMIKTAWGVDLEDDLDSIWRRHSRDGQLTGWIKRPDTQ